MKLHELQQALEALGVWKAIKKAQSKTSQIINTSGVILQRFIEMQDTPSGYKGSAGKVVKVNANETGLEFSSNSGTDWGEIGGTLSDQTDLINELDKIEDESKRYTFFLSC